jgi:hypothetical protein
MVTTVLRWDSTASHIDEQKCMSVFMNSDRCCCCWCCLVLSKLKCVDTCLWNFPILILWHFVQRLSTLMRTDRQTDKRTERLWQELALQTRERPKNCDGIFCSFHCLFVCSTFNDAFSVTQTILYSVEWKDDKWMTNWKRCGRTRSWPNYPGICLKGLRKTTKVVSRDGQSPGWDFNPRNSECKAALLTTRLRLSIFQCLNAVLHKHNSASVSCSALLFMRQFRG